MAQMRFIFRTLLNAPTFTAVAVLTLALGIGANSAMFSILDAVLLRTLPYPAAERLVRVGEVPDSDRSGIGMVSYPNFLDLVQYNTVFDAMAAFHDITVNVSTANGPELLRGTLASSHVFEVFGIVPELGRSLAASDEQPSVVFGHDAFVRLFGGDPKVLGSTIELDGSLYRIAGVMPQSFVFPTATDLWVSVSSSRPDHREELNGRGARPFQVVGRLNAGLSIQHARTELELNHRRLQQAYPAANRSWAIRSILLHDYMVRDVQPTLWILVGAVVLLTLIACANVSNMLLMRASRRQREMAIRFAVGASRASVVRQILAESLALAVLGGGFGLLMAQVIIQTLPMWAPAGMPFLTEVRIDSRVLCYTAMVTLLTSVLFGIVPALRLSRSTLDSALKSGVGAAGSTRAQTIFVVAQIALCMMLLANAGLLIKSLILLQQTDPGFQPERLLTVQVYRAIPADLTPESAFTHWSGFYQQLLSRVRALPGVEAAGATIALPIEGRSFDAAIQLENRTVAPTEQASAYQRIVSTNYFQVIKTPLVRGRLFTDQDNQNSPRVSLINETFARRYFPDRNPIGERLKINAFSAGTSEIVGVVSDIRQQSLSTDVVPQVYHPLTQLAMPWLTLVIRTRAISDSLVPSVRREVLTLDSKQPLGRVVTMENLIASSLAPSRFRTILLGMFSAVALILSVVGVYGVVGYSVAGRQREISIRMAIGARSGEIQWLVAKNLLWTIGIGLALGAGAGLAASRILASLLYRTSDTDPLVFLGAALLFACVAMIAASAPVIRITRIDPTLTLRAD